MGEFHKIADISLRFYVWRPDETPIVFCKASLKIGLGGASTSVYKFLGSSLDFLSKKQKK